MSAKSTFLNAFNTIFDSVLVYVAEIHPDNPHIISGQKSMRAVHAINPALTIQAWYRYVYIPYKDDLETGGIEFFLQKDYTADINGLSKAAAILNIIDQIRTPLRLMSDTHKSVIYTRITKLNLLSEKWAILNHSAITNK